MDMEFVRATSLMLVINLVYAVVALFVGVFAVRLVDKLMLKKIDLEEEITKGNVAAAIFGGVLVLFVAIIIGFALGS
jgi:uncharacterized membrane protein YjfL (UPF0719 family)